MGMGHRGDGFVDVVEDDHAVVEGEAQVGQAGGRPAAGWAGARRSARRRSRHSRRPRRRSAAGRGTCGAGRRPASLPAAAAGRDVRSPPRGLPVRWICTRLPIERLEAQERARAEEAVAAQPLAADDAFEEERPVAFLDLAEGGDRRQRVADQLAIDRDDVALLGQLQKLVKGRQVVVVRAWKT